MLKRCSATVCLAISLVVAQPVTAVSLEQLRDIHLPAEPPTLQFTPFWWLLLCLLLSAITLAVFSYRRRRRAADPIIATRRRLDNNFNQWCSDRNTSAYLHSTAIALKLHAQRCANRHSTARLTGRDWVNWLNTQSLQPLGSIGERALTCDLYQADPRTDIHTLHQALCSWLIACGKRSDA